MSRTVAEASAEARRSAGLSQEALAQLLGVSKATISMLECGQRTPKVDFLVRLASALKVPAHSLLPDSHGSQSTAAPAAADRRARKPRAKAHV